MRQEELEGRLHAAKIFFLLCKKFLNTFFVIGYFIFWFAVRY